jgi:subtilisin family serine protease
MLGIDPNQKREYVVTVRKDVDWKIIHDELVHDTSADDNVDSNIIPDRECECVKERENNRRNTHYSLTENEAIRLRNDPRITGVVAIADITSPKPRAIQEGNFNRNNTSTGNHDNWGLLRHINQTNTFNNSTSDPGGTYDYVLDGSGVDVIIVDTGIQVGHPEWQDTNGVTRLQQIDWFAESGIAGTQPAGFYTDVDGHGTHCIGTMAGKTFGWAKNARIYSITLYGNSGNELSTSDALDCILGFHNAKGGSRPTVVNMSFGYVWYLKTNVTPNQFSVDGTTWFDISGGRYRGVTHSDTAYADLQNYGLIGELQGGSIYGFPRKYASLDADVETLINNGIHVCIAAGNDSMKIDVPGGIDYDNYLSFENGGDTYYVYYHRGGTPSVNEGGDTLTLGTQDSPTGDLNEGFMVGALENSDLLDGSFFKDKKTTFSQSGPGVNIYTAGRYIISAQPNTKGSPYFADSNYKQSKYSGTSMAAPQMVGMVACLLQAHPDWTPAQVKKYFESNAVSNLNDTGNNNDYTINTTIHGGPNRVAYFPMHGQRPFSVGE